VHQVLANLYVASLPFIFAFTAGAGRLTPTLGISALMLVVMLVDGRATGGGMRNARVAVLAGMPLLIYLAISPLLTDSFGIKSLTHYAAYAVSLIFFYIVPAAFVALNRDKLSADGVLGALTSSAVVASVYAIAQFALKNTVGLNIETFLPVPDGIEAESMFLGLYYRARGFAPEPGHFALFLETCLPFIVYFFSRNAARIGKARKVASIGVVVVAILTTASPVPIFLLTMNFFLVAVLIRPRMRVLGWLGIGGVAIALAAAIYYLDVVLQGSAPLRELVWQFLFDKVDSFSAEDRMSRLETARQIVAEAGTFAQLFGNGAAITYKLGLGDDQTIFLLYPLLFVELGLIGLLLFALLFGCFALTAKRLPGLGGRLWWWGFLSILMHYIIIGNYWYPYLWLFGVIPYLFDKDVEPQV
jgi:hypothetical protein